MSAVEKRSLLGVKNLTQRTGSQRKDFCKAKGGPGSWKIQLFLHGGGFYASGVFLPNLELISVKKAQMVGWPRIILWHILDLAESVHQQGTCLGETKDPQSLFFKLPGICLNSGGTGRSQPSWKFVSLLPSHAPPDYLSSYSRVYVTPSL